MSTAWRVQTTRHRCRLCAGRPLDTEAQQRSTVEM